jgi:hypothetical protein
MNGLEKLYQLLEFSMVVFWLKSYISNRFEL